MRRPVATFLVPLLVALAVAVIVVASGLAQTFNDVGRFVASVPGQPASSDSSPVSFTVHRGEITASIALRLEHNGLVRSAWYFIMLARLQGVEAELEAGDYQLRADMPPSEILERLRHGRGRWSRVTIPEGWRLAEITDLLDSKEIAERRAFLEATTRLKPDGDFGRPPGASLEGYLFPDTYLFSADMDVESIVSIMLNTFQRRFDPRMRQQASERGLSVHQVVTLASIVEREAVVPAERPLIARVYLNRLRAGMLLQADPTVQYAVARGEQPPTASDGYWKRELTRADLALDSPYNTYRHPGLPPGPIANPGMASLSAVLTPAEADYLYFVARPDGSHAFARTYEEHLANVRRFRPGE